MPLIACPRPLTLIAALVASAVAAPALAEPVTLTPLAAIRLQRETAAQDDLPASSDALTLRVRTGVQAKSGRWSLRAEGQGNLAIVEDYNNGLNGRNDRPVVPDPESIGLYQGFVRYTSPALTATLGRQEISLDDERFVGIAPIRMNAQTFDAVRAQYTGIKGLKVDASYAWSYRTVWGIDGFGARQQAVSGDNIFVNAAYKTPAGTLTGFAYLVDLDEAAVQNFRLSSQTYGLRFTGTQKLPGDAAVGCMASYARQSDYGRNPNDYAADFLAAEASLEHRGWRLAAAFESLGASDGRPFTSLQTPLSSGVKFLGLAGKFLPTPSDGGARLQPHRRLHAQGSWPVEDLALPVGDAPLHVRPEHPGLWQRGRSSGERTLGQDGPLRALRQLRRRRLRRGFAAAADAD